MRLAEAEEQIAARQKIDAAKRVLMAESAMNEPAAHRYLRREAMDHQKKLHQMTEILLQERRREEKHTPDRAAGQASRQAAIDAPVDAVSFHVAHQLSNGALRRISHTFRISRPGTRRRPMSANPVPMAVCGFFLATSASASANAFLKPRRG